MYPGGSRPSQSTERSSGLGPKADEPEPARDEVVNDRIDSDVDRNIPAISPPAAVHAGIDGDSNDMMILEASPDDLERERPRAGDDEVLFIG